MNDFTDKLITKMLDSYLDEESFAKVVRMVVQLTAEAAAREVSAYSDHKLPASEYSTMLRDFFGLK